MYNRDEPFTDMLQRVMNELGDKNSPEFDSLVEEVLYFLTNHTKFEQDQEINEEYVKGYLDEVRQGEREEMEFDMMDSLLYGLVAQQILNIEDFPHWWHSSVINSLVIKAQRIIRELS